MEAKRPRETPSSIGPRGLLGDAVSANPRWKDGAWCVPAAELAPTAHTKNENCKGFVWSSAIPGTCQEQPDKSCLTGLKTKVEIHEYEFQWDAETRSCKATRTRKDPQYVEVENCAGDIYEP